MPYIPTTMLAVLGIFLAIASSGCGSTATTSNAVGGSIPATTQTLTLNYETGFASTPNWSAKMMDCSTTSYSCTMLQQSMILAFPKRCSEAMTPSRVPNAEARLIGIAPAPHIPPPSGSYVVDRFPKIWLRYQYGKGFVEVRQLEYPPEDSRFDPNKYEAAYRVTIVGQNPFICSD